MNKKTFLAIVTGVAVVIVAIILGAVFYRTYSSIGHVSTATVHTKVSDMYTHGANQNIRFEIATTTVAQKRGLSGRLVIPNNYAMLFVFPNPGVYGFWMKDMLVPIDIIWLSDNGTIISIEKSVQPNTYPHVFYPQTPARYVLEAHAGFSLERGWHVGSVVGLPSPYGKKIFK